MTTEAMERPLPFTALRLHRTRFGQNARETMTTALSGICTQFSACVLLSLWNYRETRKQGAFWKENVGGHGTVRERHPRESPIKIGV
jgi:hypothetical protein